MHRSNRRLSHRTWLAGLSLIAAACSSDASRVVAVPRGAQFGKAPPSTTLSVTSTNPSAAKRGDRVQVHVFGSGFDRTAQAGWERNGVTDPRVTVLSTAFVSSSEVVADVQVANDADIDLYDVAVSILATDGGRKKGVGIELFVVTTVEEISAVIQTGTSSIAWNLNDAGQVVGRFGRTHAYFWDAATGADDLGPGQAFGVSASGTIVVGIYDDGTVHYPKVWTGSAHNWIGSPLSMACAPGAGGGIAWSISPDGTLIGGRIAVPVTKKTSVVYPVLWSGPASNCRILAVPPGKEGGAGYVLEVTAVGAAVGAVNSGGTTVALAWDAAGAPTILGTIAGSTYDEARAVNRSGTIAAGISNAQAVAWFNTGSGWSAPLVLPCGSWATGVNDSGIIVGKDCDGNGRWWQVANGAVVSTGLMPGFSPASHPNVEAVNNNTTSGQPWAAGGPSALFWRLP